MNPPRTETTTLYRSLIFQGEALRSATPSADSAEFTTLTDLAFGRILAGRYQEAEPLCHQLIRDFPHEVHGFDWLAMVCEKRGDLQGAVELLRQAIVIADAKPDSLGYGAWRDMMYEKQLELEAALTHASRPLPATVADDDDDVPADDTLRHLALRDRAQQV